MVRVRFAPSPTGFLHIGGARTALFNWLYAKSQGGKFILRIEDTDKERSKEEYLQEILASMKWLGLNWDEFYKQSDRFSDYQKYAKKLLDEGKAYKDGEAVILPMPRDQEVKFFDLIRGEIKFDTENFFESKPIVKEKAPDQLVLEDAPLEIGGKKVIKDIPLLKADGSPTYSFACVIDDSLMEISHVIRGEDHISNTPKQMIIYQALGFKIPKFAHLPLILDEEGGRMSKRAGAVAVTDYQKLGFIPEAVVNYLMLLGWSPGNNQEVCQIDTAIKNFSIKKVNKAGAAFSMDKLKWINSQYIKKMDTPALTTLLIPFLQEKKYLGEDFDRQRLENIVNLFKARLSTLVDFLDWADFVFVKELDIDPALKSQYLSQDKAKAFELLAQRLEKIEDFSAGKAEEVFRSLVAELGINASDLVHPVRVALTGKAVGPGLFETMAVLGKERTIQRLRLKI